MESAPWRTASIASEQEPTSAMASAVSIFMKPFTGFAWFGRECR
jgi:hypothetical protein